ncbi:Tuberous sclerosis 2-like protein [Ascosphaera acerosa]|nr:Tuberous sclerosis 2-like protein [Ascosphaera acerosa]
MEGRGSRVAFGFDSLHRASQALSGSSTDATSPLSSTPIVAASAVAGDSAAIAPAIIPAAGAAAGAAAAAAAAAADDVHGHAPELDTVLRGLQKETCDSLAGAIETAELAARWVGSTRCWNPEQCLALWFAGSWLVKDSSPSPEAFDGRRAGAALLQRIADRQDLPLAARQKIVCSVSSDLPSEAVLELVNPLVALTDYGRKVDFPDEPLLPVITRWIFPVYEVIAMYRSKVRRGQRPPYVADESVLSSLFQLVVDVVTLQREPPPEPHIEAVLEQVFLVCRRTSVASDIKNALSIIDAIISIGRVPRAILAVLLEVLCSIQASVKQLAGPTSRTVRSLAKTDMQTDMVDTLHIFIQETGQNERGIHVVRGAVSIFSDLLATYGQDRMPQIDFATLVTTLQAACEKSQRSDGRIDAEILEVCLDLLRSRYVDIALQGSHENDFSRFISTIIACTRKPQDQPVSLSLAAAAKPPATAPTPGPAPAAAAATGAATLEPAPSPSTLTRSSGLHSDEPRCDVSPVMSRIIETLETLWTRLDDEHKGQVCALFMSCHSYLTDRQSQLAQEFYREKRLCYPENPEWTMRCKSLISNFIVARDKVPEVRAQAVETLSEVYMTGAAADVFDDHETVRQLAHTLAEERSYVFAQRFIAFLVDLAADCTDQNFDQLVSALSQTFAADERDKADVALLATATHSESASTRSTASAQSQSLPSSQGHVPNEAEDSISSLATLGLVRIVLRTLNGRASRAAAVFEKLIDICLSPTRPVGARLAALKLLFRIRCDSAGALYVIPATENEFLVNVLTRTNERASDVLSRAVSLADLKSVQSDEALSMGGSGAGQSSKQALKDGVPLPLSTLAASNRATPLAKQRWTPPVWTYLEPRGLPEDPPEPVSTRAVAFVEEHVRRECDCSKEEEHCDRVVFKLYLWLEAIIMLLQREKDWAVYSYLLAHLGPQLTNRHLLQYSAIPQIKLLRSVLCEQLKNESFLEPFVGSGVKKADVAVCLYDALTVLVCYKNHYAKSEQDDIVRCFMLGIGSWEGTSRGCIHALSLCCHEVPQPLW